MGINDSKSEPKHVVKSKVTINCKVHFRLQNLSGLVLFSTRTVRLLWLQINTHKVKQSQFLTYAFFDLQSVKLEENRQGYAAKQSARRNIKRIHGNKRISIAHRYIKEGRGGGRKRSPVSGAELRGSPTMKIP